MDALTTTTHYDLTDRRTHVERLNDFDPPPIRNSDMDETDLRVAALQAAIKTAAAGESVADITTRAAKLLAWIKGERDPDVVAAEAEELAKANHKAAVAAADKAAAEAAAAADALKAKSATYGLAAGSGDTAGAAKPAKAT